MGTGLDHQIDGPSEDVGSISQSNQGEEGRKEGNKKKERWTERRKKRWQNEWMGGKKE